MSDHGAEHDDQTGARGPHIRVQPGGPYVVSGDVPVTRRRAVVSEHGEPLVWQRTAEVETNASVSLCRCGASANKPFCDSSHRRVGFEGTEAAPSDSYDERAKVYVGTGVEMRDDRSICEHAGFCGNRLTNVWKMMKGDATEDSIARSQLMAMVERCPSGALTYRLPGETADIEPELAVGISVIADGPLAVTGRIPLERADGQAHEARNRVTLCRCGASSIKPLCDGSHKEVGFSDSSLRPATGSTR